MLSESHAVAVDRATLRTKRIGDPDGRTLLFLHGGLGTLEDFDPIFTQLGNFQSVLVDSRGHGGSTLGAPLNYERLALDAEAVIDFYGLASPVVVGHSDGGIAAIRMAAAKRKNLGGLILLGTDADMPPASVVDGIFAKLTPEGWRSKFSGGVALYERLNAEPDFDSLFHEVLKMWCDPAPENYPGHLTRNIACPTLVLGGDRDHLVSPQVTFDLAQRIAGAHLGILPFGSHAMLQEQPDRVLPYIFQFIGTLA